MDLTNSPKLERLIVDGQKRKLILKGSFISLRALELKNLTELEGNFDKNNWGAKFQRLKILNPTQQVLDQFKSFSMHLELQYLNQSFSKTPLKIEGQHNFMLILSKEFPPILAPNVRKIRLEACNNVNFDYLKEAKIPFSNLHTLTFKYCSLPPTSDSQSSQLILPITFFPTLTLLEIKGSFFPFQADVPEIAFYYCPQIVLEEAKVPNLESFTMIQSRCTTGYEGLSSYEDLTALTIRDSAIDDNIWTTIRLLKNIHQLSLRDNSSLTQLGL